MALADDVARVARELFRLNVVLGLFGQRAGDGDMSRLAKAAGATVPQLRAWMDGGVQPTTAQALAVLDALPLPAVGPLAAVLNGKAG